MNNIFDIKRAANYAGYTFNTGIKTYAITAGAALVCCIVSMLFMMSIQSPLESLYTEGRTFYNIYYGQQTDPLWPEMRNIFWIGLYVVMCISASMSYGCLGSKEGRISELMLPASHLEKYAVRWIIFLPLSVVIFIAGFCIVELIRLLIVNIAVADPLYLAPLWAFDYGPLPFEFISTHNFAIAVFMQSVFLLGSAVWPKLSMLKTLLACAITGVLMTLLGAWLANMMFLHGMSYDEPFNVAPETLTTVICYTLSIVLYVITYYRIKEIEIIQRW